MPQLDKLTFLSQLFWLIITFSSLYIVSVKWILPSVSTILKVRKTQLNNYEKQVSSLDTETQKVISEHDNTVINSITETNKLLNTVSLSSANWYNQSVAKTDQEIINSLSKDYITFAYILHLTYLSWQEKLTNTIMSSK
jgi:F0F1-type ATP synthase membrane subunit b/b'